MLRAFLCFIRYAELTVTRFQRVREFVPQPRPSKKTDTRPVFLLGGEDEIRTHGTSCPAHTLSRRAPSTTRTPLRTTHIIRYSSDIQLCRGAACVLSSLRDDNHSIPICPPGHISTISARTVLGNACVACERPFTPRTPLRTTHIIAKYLFDF